MSVELHFECTAIEISNPNYIICCVYRSPDGDLNIFFDKLTQLLNMYESSHSKLIIGGDFNIDMLKNNQNKSKLLDLFSSYGLKRCIKK